jgi:hypothetical protein
MKSGGLRTYCMGFFSGAGVSLFALFLLAQLVPITLEHWPRIAVGAVGMALLAIGIILRPRRPSPASPQES